jgi:hypothetical protein
MIIGIRNNLELAFWNMIIPLMTGIQQMRLRLRGDSDQEGKYTFHQEITRIIIWSVIGLLLGIGASFVSTFLR